MRGLTISAHGGVDRIENRQDLADQRLERAQDARLRLRAAALNHLDLFLLGGLPGVTITPDWVLGADGTGVVESVGSAVTNVAVGDAVGINAGIRHRTCEQRRAGG